MVLRIPLLPLLTGVEFPDYVVATLSPPVDAGGALAFLRQEGDAASQIRGLVLSTLLDLYSGGHVVPASYLAHRAYRRAHLLQLQVITKAVSVEDDEFLAACVTVQVASAPSFAALESASLLLFLLSEPLRAVLGHAGTAPVGDDQIVTDGTYLYPRTDVYAAAVEILTEAGLCVLDMALDPDNDSEATPGLTARLLEQFPQVANPLDLVLGDVDLHRAAASVLLGCAQRLAAKHPDTWAFRSYGRPDQFLFGPAAEVNDPTDKIFVMPGADEDDTFDN